jgi:nickel/cobalt transporter (NiCoT) family protein
MSLRLNALFNDASDDLRTRIIAIYCILLIFNIAARFWAVVAFRHYPVLLGTALLAYALCEDQTERLHRC